MNSKRTLRVADPVSGAVSMQIDLILGEPI